MGEDIAPTGHKKCPECNQEILIMPIREPVPNSTAGGAATAFAMNSTQDISWPYQVSYTPTSRDYKCCNPKCWVTKITEDWE